MLPVGAVTTGSTPLDGLVRAGALAMDFTVASALARRTAFSTAGLGCCLRANEYQMICAIPHTIHTAHPILTGDDNAFRTSKTSVIDTAPLTSPR